jgi:hypothetical protein
MHIVGWCRQNGFAYQSLMNENSVEEMRTPRDKSKLMPAPRDAPSEAMTTQYEYVKLARGRCFLAGQTSGQK